MKTKVKIFSTSNPGNTGNLQKEINDWLETSSIEVIEMVQSLSNYMLVITIRYKEYNKI